MTNIAKYNLKTILLPALAVVLLLMTLGYAFAPSEAGFWSSLNPVEAFSALAFAFGFGMGLPDVLALGLVGVLLLSLWLLLFFLARRFVR